MGFLFIIGPLISRAQTDPDSLNIPSDIELISDSLSAASDSLLISASDSLAAEVKEPDSAINSKVSYSANDSIINDVQNKKVYLYGNASVSYEDITLKAAYIAYDFETFTVHAEGRQDTLGTWHGVPLFQQAESEFEAREMDYNFKSKKAYVKQVETAVIEGTLTGKQVKTTQDNSVIYVRKGEYCPCEDPNANTRFKIGRLKVIKDDKIVTGPGYMALHNVPTPIVFPFGFFPNAEKKQAGIIIPSYGNGFEQGYFLADGGVYLPIGDNVDTKILGDIYTRGSWGLENITRYKKRYKYDGIFDIEYNKLKTGDPDLSNYSEQTNFFITWRHTQDPKARPNSNFSADIRAGSTANYQNNLNSGQNDYLTNTFRSNIRYQTGFYDSPWSLAVNAGHEQNSQTELYSFTLPEFTANRARTFPLDGLFNDNPKQAFYEKIGLNYTGSFKNTLTATESDLALNNWDELKKGFRNGVRHAATVSTSLKAGPVSINPSISYTERWYFETHGRVFNEETQEFETDTIPGFSRNYDYSFNTSFTTKMYGMYSFLGDGLVKAIRHTMTPSVTYTYRPNFDPREYGFYGSNGALGSYNPYEDGIFGSSPSGVSNSLSFSLVNNIEAKVINRADTTSRYKKIPILENISASTSYNFAADSLKLTPINISGRTKVTKYANLTFQGIFEPYSYVVNADGTIRRVDTFLWERERTVATFESGSIAVNAAGIGSSMYGKSRRQESEIVVEGENEEDAPIVQPTKKGMFEDFSIPWNFNLGYSLNARRFRSSEFVGESYMLNDSIALTQSIQFNGDFELFRRVKVRFTSGYDFVLKELTPTTFIVNVDLNCWELNARVIPFGDRRSYNLSINIRSSMLKDLKLERNRSFTSDENFFF